MPSTPRRLLPVLLGGALTGCGGGGPAPSPPGAPGGEAPSGEVTVFAAASLTDAFTTLGERFERAHPGTQVRFSFAGSSTLAQQVQEGAPADVFASASTEHMQDVVDAGDAADPRTFAENVAEIAVAPESVGRVTRLEDLARPDVKVALCEPEVPCGALAAQVLDRAGVRVRPVTHGLDVRAVLAAVASGEVDAGLVYVTDVRTAGGEVSGVEVPAEVNASTSYPIATVTRSRNPAAARAFRDHVLSPDGQAVLADAGFVTR